MPTIMTNLSTLSTCLLNCWKMSNNMLCLSGSVTLPPLPLKTLVGMMSTRDASIFSELEKLKTAIKKISVIEVPWLWFVLTEILALSVLELLPMTLNQPTLTSMLTNKSYSVNFRVHGIGSTQDILKPKVFLVSSYMSLEQIESFPSKLTPNISMILKKYILKLDMMVTYQLSKPLSTT